MSKVKACAPQMRKWIQGNAELTTDGKVIFCTACEKPISCSKKFQVGQHLKTVSHQNNLKKASKPKQKLLSNAVAETSANNDPRRQFSMDLAKALTSANIPWNKVNNPAFSKFLGKYQNEGQNVPDESTLRKNYLPQCYEQVTYPLH